MCLCLASLSQATEKARGPSPATQNPRGSRLKKDLTIVPVRKEKVTSWAAGVNLSRARLGRGTAPETVLPCSREVRSMSQKGSGLLLEPGSEPDPEAWWHF